MNAPAGPRQAPSPPRLRRALQGSLILTVLLVGLAFVRFPLWREARGVRRPWALKRAFRVRANAAG